MRGVRVKNHRAKFSIAGLQMFAEDVDRSAIRAIARLCDLATTHPDFGKRGNPGAAQFHDADRATDTLWAMFFDNFADDDAIEGAPRYVVDSADASLTVSLHGSADNGSLRRRERKPRDAKRKPGLRLLAAPDARN